MRFRHSVGHRHVQDSLLQNAAPNGMALIGHLAINICTASLRPRNALEMWADWSLLLSPTDVAQLVLTIGVKHFLSKMNMFLVIGNPRGCSASNALLFSAR